MFLCFYFLFPGGANGGATDVLDEVVKETNRYAQDFITDFPNSPCATRWNPINRATLQAFIAVILFMGMVKLPTLAMYWSTHWLFNFPIADIMSRDDFFDILRFLHCANNAVAIARGLPGYDRLFKIRNVCNMFVKNWQRNYYPKREVSIDECIIGFKGRTFLKQYNPKKPHKWGICVWSLAEATTGYSYGWQIYAGKNHMINPSGHGATYDIVMNLLEENDLLDVGHHVYMDNFFTSPILFQHLSNHWTGACGTLRVNRALVPAAIKQANPRKGDPPVFAKDGRLQYVSWQDKKKVSAVSTVHNDKTFNKTVKDKAAPNHEREVEKPNLIELYTKYMRGVDLADQMMWHSLFDHKNVKWWKKIFFALLETSFVNTLITYKHLHPREKVDRNKIRLNIIDHLLANYTRKPSKRGRRQSNPPPLRMTSRHFETPNPEFQANGRRKRFECVVCSPPAGKVCRTTNMCRECNVPVHKYSCFERLHTLKEYKFRCDGPGAHE